MAKAALTRPPREARGRDFDLWCHELFHRGYSVWAMAQRCGVSENRVLHAIERVDDGRYGNIR